MESTRKVSEPLRFILNGVEIYNSRYKLTTPPSRIISEIFSNIPNFELWSEDAIKIFVIGSLENIVFFYKELMKEKDCTQRSKIISLVKRADNLLRFVNKLNREQTIKAVYDLTLACEGVGPLRNFGMCDRWGDKKQGDPEKCSIKERL